MIRGFDYASVDDDKEPNFTQIVDEGFSFVIIRRSYPLWDIGHAAWHLRPDPCYARDAANARAAGLVVGSYLFPTFHSLAPSMAEQWGNFEQAGGEILDGDLPVTIDLEFPGNGISDTRRSAQDVLGLLHQLVEIVAVKTGLRPMIYTSHVQVHDDNGLGLPEDYSADWLSSCPLWQKVPYKRRAGQPIDESAPLEPVLPGPWKHKGYWIRQGQGDAKVPGLGQADIDDFHVFDSAAPGPDLRFDFVADALKCSGCPTPELLTQNLLAFQKGNGLTEDHMIGPRSFARLIRH